METEREDEMDGLNAYFDAARRSPGPGDDLVARVLADAGRVQADAALAVPALAPTPRRMGIVETLGGWIGISGLAAVCATGLVAGIALPNLIDATAVGSLAELLQTDTSVGFAGFDAVAFATEFEVEQ